MTASEHLRLATAAMRDAERLRAYSGASDPAQVQWAQAHALIGILEHLTADEERAAADELAGMGQEDGL